MDTSTKIFRRVENFRLEFVCEVSIQNFDATIVKYRVSKCRARGAKWNSGETRARENCCWIRRTLLAGCVEVHRDRGAQRNGDAL